MRDVVAAANIVDVVGLRTSLRKSSGTRYMGRCPFHEERSPSFSVNADLNLYHCFGCGKGGDVVTLRPRDGRARLRRCDRVARRAVPGPARVRGELAAGGRVAPAARAAVRRARPGGGVLRAPSLGGRRRRAGSRVSREPRARRGDLEGVPARASRRVTGSPRKAREKGFTADELRAAGLTNQRGNDYFPPRLMFPLADARGQSDRLPGPEAPRRRPAEGQVRQLARERAVQEEQRPLRPPSRAACDREAGPRRGRRGQHRRDRACGRRGSSRSSRRWERR